MNWLVKTARLLGRNRIVPKRSMGMEIIGCLILAILVFHNAVGFFGADRARKRLYDETVKDLKFNKLNDVG